MISFGGILEHNLYYALWQTICSDCHDFAVGCERCLEDIYFQSFWYMAANHWESIDISCIANNQVKWICKKWARPIQGSCYGGIQMNLEEGTCANWLMHRWPEMSSSFIDCATFWPRTQSRKMIMHSWKWKHMLASRSLLTFAESQPAAIPLNMWNCKALQVIQCNIWQLSLLTNKNAIH